MLTQQQLWAGRLGRGASLVVFVATLLWSPVHTFAQSTGETERHSSFLADVTKRVVLDPTTYAPALIGYDSTMRDWNSSQPFFRNGFVEHNARFTISGRPDDMALAYGVGRRRILSDALVTLETSAVNNITDSIFERVLAERYPNHRRLIRVMGWIEKGTFASYMSYRLSAAHYRQWQQNEAMSRQLGLR